MPTGYTCFIEDGAITNAKDFILLCARSFSALSFMRDMPLSAQIPEQIEESTYYKDMLDKEFKNLGELLAMSKEDIHFQNATEYNKKFIKNTESMRKSEEINQRYNKILDGVKKWIPPTQEHEALKDFCIEQINISTCNGGTHISIAEKNSDDIWIIDKVRSCLDKIEYYKKQVQLEHTRVSSNNKWLRELRESLSGVSNE